MQRLHSHITSRRSPAVAGPSQRVKARADQVQNSAGGFGFAVNPFERLARFLVLGSEGGTYYASERKLTKENCKALEECLRTDYFAAVNMIVEKSQRAPKMDPVIFAFAYACAFNGTEAQRHYALSRLADVCRTGTHLFMFMEYSKAMRGGGRGFRTALAKWYTQKAPRDVAFQVSKYAQRNGWSHADVLRLAHPRTSDPDMQVAFRYALGKADQDLFNYSHRLPVATDTAKQYLSVVNAVKKEEDVSKIASMVEKFRLPREVLPTESLNSPKVWQALLDAGMPMTALIRNLGKLSSTGLLVSGDRSNVSMVCSQIDNERALEKARIHPLSLLVAFRTYRSGHGQKGSLTWTPVPAVVDALESAFYKSFGYVEPTGKRIMLALDVSGSMGVSLGTLGITCREAAAVMAMVQARVERNAEFYGFSHVFKPLRIDSRMKLDEVCRVIHDSNFGSTDCSLPALWSINHREAFDAFCIYTDNETWAGHVHPYRALSEYRRLISPQCRQVVVGMTANGFTIADPSDPLSLDVVGFDIDTPNVISWFIGQ